MGLTLVRSDPSGLVDELDRVRKRAPERAFIGRTVHVKNVFKQYLPGKSSQVPNAS